MCQVDDVLVKNQESALGQVTSFPTSQPHQKFFQVSFCVAKDDNSKSISAWNEKKPSVCPRGKRFHSTSSKQSWLNFMHSFAPFFVKKRRQALVFILQMKVSAVIEQRDSQDADFSPFWYDRRGWAWCTKGMHARLIYLITELGDLGILRPTRRSNIMGVYRTSSEHFVTWY